MFGFDENTKGSDFTRLPNLPAGCDVVVLMTEAKDSKGVKGHYAIFEGVVSEITKGSGVAVGEKIKVKMVKLDDSRRIKAGMNYAHAEVIDFLEALNGEKFPKGEVAARTKEICDNIRGMAVRARAETATSTEGEAYVSRTFAPVKQTAEDYTKQLKRLEELGH